MTEATVEKIARLMHNTARAKRAESSTLNPIVKTWKELPEERRDEYRHVARKVLLKLGR